MSRDIEDRLEELEALADRQQERIETEWQRIRERGRRIQRLENEPDQSAGTDDDTSWLRRVGVAGIGLVGLVAGTAGTATASQDRLGTPSRPLSEVATDALDGGVTGNTEVTALTGNALQTLSTGSGTALATPWVDTDGDDRLELDGDAAASTGIDVTTVEADRLQETDTLPDYSAVGDDATATLNALENRFGEPIWKGSGNGVHVTGPTHGEGNDAFDDAVFVPTGEVILSPSSSSNVGIYDPDDDSYTSGPSFGSLSFGGIALAPTGDVIFAPDGDTVGIYTPARNGTGSYQDGATHGEGSNAFQGAALAPSGDVVFAPHDSDNVGVYDPSTDTYTSGDSHGEGSNAFNGAILTHTGEIVFSPADSSNVGVYDPSTDTYTSGDGHGENGPQPFDGGTLAPTGEVIFAPKDSSNVGIYDPETDTYTSGPSQTSVNDAYSGATLAATGDVIFAPKGTNGSTGVGIYAPSESGTGTFTEGASHGNGEDAYKGCALTPSGKVVFAPQDVDTVDYFDPFATTDNARGVALHPLVNHS